MALRVLSRSWALSAKFLPPSIPAEVTAKARYQIVEMMVVYKMRCWENYLELLVYTLQAVDRRVQVSDFVGLHFQLLLKVLNLTNMGVAFRSVLYLKFILSIRRFRNRILLSTLEQTFRSAMDSAISTLLVSSSWIVFSSNSSYSVSSDARRPSNSSRLRVTMSLSSWLCLKRSTVSRTNDWPSASCRRTAVRSSTVRVLIAAGESMASNLAII